MDVYVIDDPSTGRCLTELEKRHVELPVDAKVSALKQIVETQFGIPVNRQAFYGISKWYRKRFTFNTDQILRHCVDDLPLFDTMRSLRDQKIVKLVSTIAVVRPPPADDQTDDGSDVELLREVDTVAENIAAGRDTAIVVDDEDASDSDGNEEEQQPRKKRARRVKNESSETRSETAMEGGGIGEEEQHQDEESANDNNGGGEAEEDNDEEEEGGDGGDEGGDAAANDDEAGDGEGAVAGGQEEEQAPAPAAGRPPPTELRHWLRGLDANGGRFEAYADAFEREFHSLEALAVAANDVDVGLGAIFDACGVRSLGDKSWIKRAIRNLPIPE